MMKTVGNEKKVKRDKVRMTFNEVREKEIPVIWSIIDFSSNVPMSIYTDKTVVKTAESCYRGAVLSEDSRLIGEQYLLNAKKSTIDLSLPVGTFSYSTLAPRASLSFRKYLEEDVHKHNRAVPLPEPLKVNSPLGAVIKSRRSIREFGNKKMSIAELSTLLYYGDGVSSGFDHNPNGSFDATVSLGDKYISGVRTAPSGGGLYPVYLYLVVLGVDGLEAGLYKYMPLTHSLEIMRVFDEKDIDEYLSFTKIGAQIDMGKLNVGVYYIYNIYENSRKYEDMALQFALIEAGEISENIHLVATALNLASTDIGGFEKARTESFFGLDSLTHHIIHLTLVSKR